MLYINRAGQLVHLSTLLHHDRVVIGWGPLFGTPDGWWLYGKTIPREFDHA